jgi:hypothetical protein
MMIPTREWYGDEPWSVERQALEDRRWANRARLENAGLVLVLARPKP